jgi:alanyl-tRNA synthetase
MIDELRQKYLAFFEQKGHLLYPGASLKSDDPTLLFTSAGMVQFKPYFLGATPKFAGFDGVWHRVVTDQKCLRVNDIENVGRTLRHHSFFEMLGNFSFGDYFKSEAISWAWEFLTSPAHLGLDPERLHVTVYLDDDEAWSVWHDEIGIPAERISRWGESENFWPADAVSQGPNGPCGPCSEIFYDRGPAFGSEDETGPNTGTGDRFIELWNLVFTQYDRQDGGLLEPLPQRNIDTGLGFERLVAVMSGTVDAYASELFQPTIRRLEQLSGKPYLGPESVSHRVVADHVRAVSFAISDGIMPANDGAGYVIKMLLRRASRHAWLLGLREPVLYQLVTQVVEAMGAAFPEVAQGRERIQGIVRAEEEQFLRTLEAGIERVRNLLDELGGSVLPGEVAFDLWQTYGFPLDLTQEMAAERAVSVDAAGYEAARELARAASRGTQEAATLFTAGSDVLGRLAAEHGETGFAGYGRQTLESRVIGLVVDGEQTGELQEGETGLVLLAETPFYAQGGGQVGDSGKLAWEGGAAMISDTTRSSQGLYLHHAKVVRGSLASGATVHASVSPGRLDTEKHHTATHLLHAALRKVLGTQVAQAGSLVEADRLRFDLTHARAITPAQLRQVETLVNDWIQADLPVGQQVLPLAEARELGAMMLFGEKYGNEVRLVSIGDASAAVSLELCGGTHVQRSGQIGSLFITEESAVSAGVRRIEARAGNPAVHYVQEQRERLAGLAATLGAPLADIEERVARLQGDLRSARTENKTLRDRLAATQASSTSVEKGEAAGLHYATQLLHDLDAAALRNAADTLLQQPGLDVAVVASGPMLVVKTSEAARTRGAHAGNLAREIAQLAGGRGGGKPDLAQAGVKDQGALPQALAALPGILLAQTAS